MYNYAKKQQKKIIFPFEKTNWGCVIINKPTFRMENIDTYNILLVWCVISIVTMWRSPSASDVIFLETVLYCNSSVLYYWFLLLYYLLATLCSRSS